MGVSVWTPSEELLLVKLYLGGTTSVRDIKAQLQNKDSKQISNKIFSLKLSLAAQKTQAGAQQRAALLQRINNKKRPRTARAKAPAPKRQKRLIEPAPTATSDVDLTDEEASESEDEQNKMIAAASVNNGGDEGYDSGDAAAAAHPPPAPPAAALSRVSLHTMRPKREVDIAPFIERFLPQLDLPDAAKQANAQEANNSAPAPPVASAAADPAPASNDSQVKIVSQVDGITATTLKDSANSRVFVVITLPATATIHNAVYLPSVEGRLAVRLEFKRHDIAASDLRFLGAENLEYVARPAQDQHTTISLPADVIRASEIVSHPDKPWLLTIVGECSGQIIPLKVGPKLE